MPEEKKYKTEWSFSFEKLGSDIGDFVKSLGIGDEESIKQGEFSAPIDGAESARVRVDFSVGKCVVHGLTNLDNLIEADLTYVGDINFVVSGEAEKNVTLSQKAEAADWVRNVVGWIGSRGELRWDVGLATEVPMQLEVHGGVGEGKFDLRELQLTDGSIHAGAGEIDLILPARSEHYAMRVNCGVGETEIVVPAGANVDLKVHGGAGAVELEINEGAQVTAQIDGGVGECKIELPAGAAARFEAESGVGDLKFPANFTRVSGSDEFISKKGVWETPGYAEAATKIDVRYKGGVGQLVVKVG
ncbi:MAG: hypothetical protein KC547_02970 [Anaerolineae bacterium]|nr:hypothetical protein [Anaerolineae bacterium]MCA9910315.1 hypothetical protein [Anaerolineae bacterium]